MSADVARGHDGNSGGDDRPFSRQIFTGCRGEAENPTGEAGKSADWGPARKPGTSTTLWLDTPHPIQALAKIQKGIEQHLAKIYVDNNSSLKKEHWVLQPDGTHDPFKMLKIGQRARSSAGRDHGHLLSSEIYRTRREFNIGDTEAQGSRRQYADGCALHRGPDNGHGSKGQATGAHSRCWYRFWRDREGTSSLLTSLDLLTQLESQHEVDGGSRSQRGGDDELGPDEDAGGDEDADGSLGS
ncbi:hypothetical protein Tco_1358566, partial [Tanacetum coccineum]